MCVRVSWCACVCLNVGLLCVRGYFGDVGVVN